MTSERTATRGYPEVRLNEDGSLDEVVTPSFQLEQMDHNHWFLEIEHEGRAVAVWLHAKGKIAATFEHRSRTRSESEAPTAGSARLTTFHRINDIEGQAEKDGDWQTAFEKMAQRANTLSKIIDDRDKLVPSAARSTDARDAAFDDIRHVLRNGNWNPTCAKVGFDLGWARTVRRPAVPCRRDVPQVRLRYARHQQAMVEVQEMRRARRAPGVSKVTEPTATPRSLFVRLDDIVEGRVPAATYPFHGATEYVLSETRDTKNAPPQELPVVSPARVQPHAASGGNTASPASVAMIDSAKQPAVGAPLSAAAAHSFDDAMNACHFKHECALVRSQVKSLRSSAAETDERQCRLAAISILSEFIPCVERDIKKATEILVKRGAFTVSASEEKKP